MEYQNSHHCKLNFDLIRKEKILAVRVEAKTKAQPTRNLDRYQWRAIYEPITGKSARSNQRSEAVCVLGSQLLTSVWRWVTLFVACCSEILQMCKYILICTHFHQTNPISLWLKIISISLHWSVSSVYVLEIDIKNEEAGRRSENYLFFSL